MNIYTIKFAETESEMDGRGYVHFQSWQETYPGLIDAAYLEKMTLETCISIAHTRK